MGAKNDGNNDQIMQASSKQAPKGSKKKIASEDDQMNGD
jgi:hypothetical protein